LPRILLVLACRAEAPARRLVLDFLAGFDYENEDDGEDEKVRLAHFGL